jgi:hypothetical protein
LKKPSAANARSPGFLSGSVARIPLRREDDAEDFNGHPLRPGQFYEHFFRGGKHFVVSGGGGGRRFRVRTAPSFRGYEDLFTGPFLRFFHFCELEIGPDEVVVRAVRLVDRPSSVVFEAADEWTLAAAGNGSSKHAAR